jgi:precorrin-6A synthase
MIELSLVGIGTGNPEHLTRQGSGALNAADLILIPRKGHGAGDSKSDLAELRRAICAAVVTNPTTRIVPFDMPLRDSADPAYEGAVHRWHDAIAQAWFACIAAHLPQGGRMALLVWGDPSLYDSTLRIADRLALRLALRVTVVPGITALQALTAAHAIPLNEINAPVTITTGRRLRRFGWPVSTDTVAVMLDAECAFQQLDPAGITIWWGAYLSMPNQLLLSGPLGEMAATILRRRAAARQAHGWIMDTYLLRRAR